MITPGAKKDTKKEGKTPKKPTKVLFGSGGGGRPIQDPKGQKRDKKIQITFTQSDMDKIEKKMDKVGADSKSNYLRKLIMENI